jgi:hypothetical protein
MDYFNSLLTPIFSTPIRQGKIQLTDGIVRSPNSFHSMTIEIVRRSLHISASVF